MPMGKELGDFSFKTTSFGYSPGDGGGETVAMNMEGALEGPDGNLTASAFVLSQNDLLHDIEALDLDPFRLFQVTTSELTSRTGLGFDAYADADVLIRPERATSGKLAEAIDIAETRREIGTEILDTTDILF